MKFTEIEENITFSTAPAVMAAMRYYEDNKRKNLVSLVKCFIEGYPAFNMSGVFQEVERGTGIPWRSIKGIYYHSMRRSKKAEVKK